MLKVEIAVDLNYKTQITKLTVDMKAAGRFDAAQSVRHLAPVSSGVVWLRILDGQCRFVVPEEHLVFAARVDFACVLEPTEQRHDNKTT